MRILLSMLFLFFSFSIFCPGDDQKYELEVIEEYPLHGFREPSGLTYSESRDSLFMVGDEGHVAEISLDGEILNLKWLGSRDFEGVTIHPESEELYVLDEGLNRLLRLDADEFSILADSPLPEKLWGPFEGLSLDNDGRLVLVNQVKKKEGALQFLDGHKIKTGISDQSALLITASSIYIVSDRDDRLYCLDLMGELQWHCFLPGENQEGLAIDSEGFFYIAQDSGGMLKMKLMGEINE
ncbi:MULTISPECIES: SdiA-regulated domain-containing protein [unclassified Oceanispirochaeta]|uniref:SdiA-regulated domain-containing protein n=1 Tax=unclassified Oceanispirochaeta TaxID=2635722 RepID=UPI000E09CC07|nr:MULTISPECIES: SdiA-regulated domain-containing protein [unclassified Oceanispirochaeta]MBF9017775.1 SdiA-regulated domain-containing protein [Oceanispirochaeta sp. M2]NPD74339.1 hypothetical protein [Oceanispirochaeta sp. M1]RDG29819.1 hypothetical protein DV872_19750 [Oceanispirochaeta sp. M1]